jgi:hypothetical protein
MSARRWDLSAYRAGRQHGAAGADIAGELPCAAAHPALFLCPRTVLRFVRRTQPRRQHPLRPPAMAPASASTCARRGAAESAATGTDDDAINRELPPARRNWYEGVAHHHRAGGVAKTH